MREYYVELYAEDAQGSWHPQPRVPIQDGYVLADSIEEASRRAIREWWPEHPEFEEHVPATIVIDA